MLATDRRLRILSQERDLPLTRLRHPIVSEDDNCPSHEDNLGEIKAKVHKHQFQCKLAAGWQSISIRVFTAVNPLLCLWEPDNAHQRVVDSIAANLKISNLSVCINVIDAFLNEFPFIESQPMSREQFSARNQILRHYERCAAWAGKSLVP